jgi:hypothetical protein
MGAQGIATINFGSFPGNQQVSVNVTGQASIMSFSLCDAWLFPIATADHSIDEHILDKPYISLAAANVVAGVGFTIFGTAMPGSPPLYGTYTVAWVWN